MQPPTYPTLSMSLASPPQAFVPQATLPTLHRLWGRPAQGLFMPAWGMTSACSASRAAAVMLSMTTCTLWTSKVGKNPQACKLDRKHVEMRHTCIKHSNTIATKLWITLASTLHRISIKVTKIKAALPQQHISVKAAPKLHQISMVSRYIVQPPYRYMGQAQDHNQTLVFSLIPRI